MKIVLTSANVVPCVYVLWYDLITLCVPTVQVTALPLTLPPRLRHDYHPTLDALIAKTRARLALANATGTAAGSLRLPLSSLGLTEAHICTQTRSRSQC